MSTDDLLDEATRLADGLSGGMEDAHARTVLALVERVQQAEAERDSLRFELDGARAVARKDNEHLIAERDAAQGKLDKVRQWSDNNLGGAQNAALLAILDDKEG